ncbi:MAG: AgmX/PglI C-terminal domain-containing protein [Deltaproteobacteria bacterium]|nr:AgmX/PglI C-terminal domain-containing protein [Deltaproteobacteria bacterium]
MTAVERTESPRRKPAREARKAEPTPAEPEPAPPPPEAPPGNDADDGEGDGGLDATEGEWLFKQGDMLLGPVTASVLIDKIKKDELDGDTPLARDGQPFKPMSALRVFRDVVAARADEKRYAAEERAHRSAVSRARVLRALVIVALFAAPATASVFGARKIMQARPWDDTPKWLLRVPPLVDLPPRPPEVRPVTPPPANVVAAHTPEPVDATTPGGAAETVPKKPVVGAPQTVASGTPRAATANAGGADDGEPAVAAVAAGSAPPETLTNAQAIEPLKGAQADLKACFKAEMESNPDVPAQIILSYTVTEEGKAINVALDARELRERPVAPCVQKAIAALQWPRFTGERKNVSVPFKLGKPGPKK